MSLPQQPSGGTRLRVFLLDDHQMFAASLVRVLDDEPDMQVVGTAARIEEAVRLVGPAVPDVVLVDYLLPDGDGTKAIEALRHAAPGAKIVVLTALSDEQTLASAFEAGCDGFVTKDRPPEELLAALRTLRAGEAPIPAGLLSRALPLLRRSEGGGPPLTRRELEVLQLLAEGLPNTEISEHLHISLNTVRNHVRNLLAKLGAHSRLEAVAIGVRTGLIAGPGRRYG